MGECRCELSECEVMKLTDYRNVFHTDIVHVTVHEEEVSVHVIRPAVLPSVSQGIHLFLHGKSGYEELLEHACVQLLLLVQLVIIFKYGAHRLAQLLLVPVTGDTHRHLALVAVRAYHRTRQPADKVIFQRYVPLHPDVVLFPHHPTAIFYHVPPLVTIHVPLVTFSVLAELLHAVPCAGGTEQDVHVPALPRHFLVIRHRVLLRHDVLRYKFPSHLQYILCKETQQMPQFSYINCNP